MIKINSQVYYLWINYIWKQNITQIQNVHLFVDFLHFQFGLLAIIQVITNYVQVESKGLPMPRGSLMFSSTTEKVVFNSKSDDIKQRI